VNTITRLQTGKVSTSFVVLITFAITTFIAAMIYIFSLQTPQEKFAAEQERMAKVAMAEEAQSLGIPVEEYTKQKEKRSRELKHIRKIEAAIIQKDDALLDALHKEIADYDYAKYKPGLYRYIALQNNENAFRYFLEQGVPCDYKSPLGQHAFTSLLQKPYEKYFNFLIEHGCDIGIEQDTSKIQAAFAKSDNPERVLLYPLTDTNKDQYEFAFFNAIERHKTDIALEFIDRGVNPNTIKKSKYGLLSALDLSITLNEAEVAVKLIEKGANFINEKGSINQRYPILMSLSKKHVSVVEAILERDPKILSREKIADRYMNSALSLYKSDPNLKAITMAFNNGLSSTDFKNDGIEILFKAIRAGNFTLVEELLKIEVNPNQPYRMKTALSEAKRSKHPKAKEIIDLLIKSGATDDYLATVRGERGINNDSNCTIGKNISLTDLKSQIMNSPKSKLDRVLRQKEGLCLTGIALCVNDGNGSDDCVKSLDTCNQPTDSQLTNTIRDVNVCCSADFKQNYEEARCSGLNVVESFKWIDTK